MNDIIKSVKSTLEERKTLHINDPAINKYWTKLTEYLSIDEQLTIDYFNECDSEVSIFFMSMLGTLLHHRYYVTRV